MTFKKQKRKLALLNFAAVLLISAVGIFAPVRPIKAQFDPNNLPQAPTGTLGWRSFKTDQIKLGVDPFKPTNFFRVLVDKDGPVKDDAEAQNSSVKGDPIKVTTDVKLLAPDKLYISGYSGQICIFGVTGCIGSEGWDQFYVDQIFPTTKGIRGIGVGYTNEQPDKVCDNGKVFSTNVSSCTYVNYEWAFTSNTIFPLYATAEANKAWPIEILLNKANRDRYGINKASDTGEINYLNVIPYLGYASYLVPGTTNDASFLGSKTNIKVKVYSNTEAGRKAYLEDKDKPPEDQDNTGGSGTATSGGNSTIGDILNQIVTILVLMQTRIIYWIFASVLAPLIEALLQVRPYQDVFVEVIYQGWQLIRNLCNIFFIVILLVIGLGTLFRVESYNYKHLMVKVVIAALLVNFSLVFGQAILGVADTVQQQFLPDSTNVVRALGAKLMVDPINTLTKSAFITGDAATAGASFAGIARPVFAFALALGAFFTFVALAAFLVVRIVALWILLLVSPLAYVANVLPNTKYGKDWWEKFLKYAFMTPVLAFFLNLAAVFATTVFKDQENFSKLLSAEKVDGNIAQFVYIAGSQILVMLFILVGLKAAASSGTYGAAAVTNFAEKGIRKPFEWYGKGIKAGAERSFEGLQNKTGITMDPRILKEQWKEYSKEQRDKRMQARRTKPVMGIEGAPMLGDPKSVFESYANLRGAKRAIWDSKLGFRGEKFHSRRIDKNEAISKSLNQHERDNLEAKRDDLQDKGARSLALVEKYAPMLEAKQKEIAQMEKEYNDPTNPNGNYQNKDYFKAIAVEKKTLDDFIKSKVEPANKIFDKYQGELGEVDKELKQDDEYKEKLVELKIDPNTITQDQRDQAEKDYEYHEARLAKVKRPESYAAIAAHHHLLSDEKKKIEHIDEADRLIQLYEDGVAQGDRYKAEAVMQKLAKDVNFNELLEKKYGKNDYNTFVKHFMETFKNDFKLTTHEALEAMSEVSYINEANHVYNLSRAIEMDKHGHMKALSEEDHNKIIGVQMKKVEPQGQARSFWRGAFVDEELNDHHDVSKGKFFTLHDAGITILDESLSKGAGLRGVAERMQEYNRNAVAKAIEREMENPAKARPAVKKLYNNRDLMRALKEGKYDPAASR